MVGAEHAWGTPAQWHLEDTQRPRVPLNVQISGGKMEEEGKENGVCTVKRDGARDSMAVKNNLMWIAWGRAATKDHIWVCGPAAADICVNNHGPPKAIQISDVCYLC